MPNEGNHIRRYEIFKNYFPNMLKNFKEFHAIRDQILDLKEHVRVIRKDVEISMNNKEFEVLFSQVYKIEKRKLLNSNNLQIQQLFKKY